MTNLLVLDERATKVAASVNGVSLNDFGDVARTRARLVTSYLGPAILGAGQQISGMTELLGHPSCSLNVFQRWLSLCTVS